MKHESSIRISVKNSAKDAVKVRLYAAENFGGPAGLFRMKIGREWLRTDEKYVFFSSAAALSFSARMTGLDVVDEPCPEIRRNDRVRVRLWNEEKEWDEVEKCFVASPPFQGVDGRWRVFVLTTKGMLEFLCDDVEVI